MRAQEEQTQNQKQKLKQKQKRGFARDILFLLVVGVGAAVLLSFFPDRRPVVYTSMWEYMLELIQVFPAIAVLMGLFAVWVTNEQVEKQLGQASGLRGAAIALALGSLPVGPLYVAFPIARGLLSKGASTANIMIFLSAWASIKIPQAMMEIQFLGLKFAATRVVLTTTFVVGMAYLVDAMVRHQEKKKLVAKTPAEDTSE